MQTWTIDLNRESARWLEKYDVRVIDHRDEEGKERMHVRESAALEAQYGRMVMPVSCSGRNLRNPADAADVLGHVVDAAAKAMRAWEGIDPSAASNGRGGGCEYRPCLIIVDNYGAAFFATEASKRVRWFD